MTVPTPSQLRIIADECQALATKVCYFDTDDEPLDNLYNDAYCALDLAERKLREAERLMTKV